MEKSSRTSSSCQSEILYPLNNSYFLLPPAPGNHHLLPVSVNLTTLNISYKLNIQYFKALVFHCMYMPHFLYPFIFPWTLTWVASTFWQLWIMLLWTWMCKYNLKTLLSILLDKYPEVELLDHMVVLFLIFWGTCILFSLVATLSSCGILQSRQQCTRISVSLYLCQHLLFSERGGEGERNGEKHQCVRDTLISCLSYHPNWGPGLQPRHVPWLGIELATFWFIGRHSVHWTTPARAFWFFDSVHPKGCEVRKYLFQNCVTLK